MDHALQLRKFADRCMASDMERAGLRAAADEIERLQTALTAAENAMKAYDRMLSRS